MFANQKEHSYAGVKYGDKDGRLVVKPDRIQWIPLKTTTTLIIPFSEMGALRNYISKLIFIEIKTSASQIKVVHQIKPPRDILFTFLDVEALNACVALISEIRRKIKQSFMETFELKIPTVEESKQTIFDKNRELKLLYDEFVSQGILSDSDFWALHKTFLDNEKLRYQNYGLRNNSLKVLTDQKTQGTNYVKIFMPTSLKKNIFIQYPGVKRLFENKVPKTIPETQFWRQFMESYTKSDFLSKGKEILEIDIFAEQERREEKHFSEEVLLLDSKWDLTRDDEICPNYGFRKDESTAADRYDVFGSVIKFINRSSCNIVKSIEIQNFDVDGIQEGFVIPLSIPDKSKYIEGYIAQEESLDDNVKKEATQAFMSEIYDWEPNLNLGIDSNVSNRILNEINQGKGSVGLEELEIPDDFREVFTNLFSVMNEALRFHYKGSEPQKVHEMLKFYYEKAIMFRETYRTLSSIIQPSLHAIDKVLEVSRIKQETNDIAQDRVSISLGNKKRKGEDDPVALKKIKLENQFGQ